ncbi:VOC family protein [Mesorhizobium waimense]|uniref:VOC family protein n=1 Tax=Mesorhizobium waimense TaxID=1300307 RepID=UPI001ABF7DAB
MTDGTTSDAAKPFLPLAEPQLFVSDIAAAQAFYERKLGFTTRFTYANRPSMPRSSAMARGSTCGMSTNR